MVSRKYTLGCKPCKNEEVITITVWKMITFAGRE